MGDGGGDFGGGFGGGFGGMGGDFGGGDFGGIGGWGGFGDFGGGFGDWGGGDFGGGAGFGGFGGGYGGDGGSAEGGGAWGGADMGDSAPSADWGATWGTAASPDYPGAEEFGGAGADPTALLGDQVSLGSTDFSGMDSFNSEPFGNLSPSNLASVDSAFGGTPNSSDFIAKLQKYFAKAAIGRALGKMGVPGPAMGIASLGLAGSDPTAQGKAFGSLAGSTLGSVLGGPLGGMLGGYAGNAIGGTFGGVSNGAAGNGSSANANGFGGGMGNLGLGDILGAGAGLYMGNKASNQYNKQLNGLQDIFSPKGVYAQQLRQTLERKDAAAGRRSQYGPREAQLMAALAEKQASTMSSPGVVNMMGQRVNSQNQGLGTLLALGQKSGLFDAAGRGLADLFRGGGNAPSYNDFSGPAVSNNDFLNTPEWFDIGGP